MSTLAVVQTFDPGVDCPGVESPVPEGKDPVAHLRSEVGDSVAWTRDSCDVDAVAVRQSEDGRTVYVTYTFATGEAVLPRQTDVFTIEAAS